MTKWHSERAFCSPRVVVVFSSIGTVLPMSRYYFRLPKLTVTQVAVGVGLQLLVY